MGDIVPIQFHTSGCSTAMNPGAGVAELVDALDSKSSVARRVSSSLTTGTTTFEGFEREDNLGFFTMGEYEVYRL